MKKRTDGRSAILLGEKAVGGGTVARVHERADGTAAADPEVIVRPRQRTYTAEYKEQILAAVDACRHGEIGTFLRHEGLTSSMVSRWRKARDEAIQRALETKKPGPVAKEPNDQTTVLVVADDSISNARSRRAATSSPIS